VPQSSQRHGRLWPPEFRHQEPICPGSQDSPPATGATAATAEATGRFLPAPLPQRVAPNAAHPYAIAARAKALAPVSDLDEEIQTSR